MQLEKLKLKDFQGHDELEIEFSPSITTILGATDAGKSAVLRALRWVCLNDLPGDDFIREGEKKTVVSLITSHKDARHQLVRTKAVASVGTNTYELDKKEFKSFATSVPDDIRDYLRLSDINFQGQHDSPFWFAETAGEVSRRLNAIVDLSVIDTSLSNVAQEVRRAQERKAVSEERLTEAKTEYEKLQNQKDRVDEFEALKGLHEKLASADDDFHRLEGIIIEIKGGRDSFRQAEERREEIALVFSAAREAYLATNLFDALTELLDGVDIASAHAVAPPDFKPVDEAFVSFQEVDRQRDIVRDLVRRASAQALAIDALEEAAKATEKKFHEKTKGRECPLCGNPLQ